MGLTYSTNLGFELYKWSSAEFAEEYALIYTSLTDKSRFSIFRLSVKPDRVLCRVADCLCHDHPVRIHTEVIAQRDNGYYNFRAVRVVSDGTSERQLIPFRDGGSFTYNCERRSCSYVVKSKGESGASWEIFHAYGVSMKKTIKFFVNITCDKVTGLSAEFRGPFYFTGWIQFSSEPSDEDSDSLVQHEVNGEPPQKMNAVIESVLTGTQYILFKQGKGNSLTEASGDGMRVVINTGATFYGHGNGGFITKSA